MTKIRLWLAGKLIGSTAYIKNVTFYQTVCLDIKDPTHLNNCKIDLGHEIPWKNKSDGFGFSFGHYRKDKRT